MAHRYEITCDSCGKVVRAMSGEEAAARDNWRLDLQTTWWEPTEKGLIALKKAAEVDLDVCLECATELAGVVKDYVKRRKATKKGAGEARARDLKHLFPEKDWKQANKRIWP